MPYEEAIEKMNEWDKWLELAFAANLLDEAMNEKKEEGTEDESKQDKID